MSPVLIQIMWALQFLGTPMGVLALAGFVFLLAITLIVPQFKYVLLAMTIIASTLSLTDVIFQQPLIFPLQQMRNQARPVTIAFIVLFLISLLKSPQGTRHKYVVGATVWFFIFEVITSFRLMFGGLFGRGGPELIVFGFMFLTLGLALARSLSTWNDCMNLVRGLAATGATFAIFNVLQFLAHPGSVTINHRFRGTTGNPQHVAAFSALLMLPMLYLLIRSGGTKVWRVVFAVIFAILVAMLLWTASRTGLLMAVIGVGLLFRTRLSRLAIAGVVVGFLVLVVLNFTTEISGSHVEFSRLVSTQNTRAAVWNHLASQFIENPIVGVLPQMEIAVGENSYLSVAGRFGFMGLIPLAIAMALIGKVLWRLQQVGSALPDKMMADLVIAGLAQILIGAVFEGFLLGTLSVEPFMLYIYLTIAAFLLEYAALPKLEEETIEEYLPEMAEAIPGGI